MPGLLEDLVNFKIAVTSVETTDPSIDPDSTSRATDRTLSLQAKINTNLSSLNRWYQIWSTTYPAAVNIASSEHFFEASNTPYPFHLFGPPLLFPSLLLANEYTLYNTTIFLLLTIASQLSSSIPVSPVDQAQAREDAPFPTTIANTMIPSNLSHHRRLAAIEISRAVPYHLQFDNHAYSGAYLLCFPLNILLGIYGVKSEEGQWIASVLADIASNWGIMAGNAWLRHAEEKSAKGESVNEDCTYKGWW